MTSVGILGYGEAGYAFAGALARNGATVRAHDKAWETSSARDRSPHGQSDGMLFCSLRELLAGSELVLSTVTTDAALDAAAACRPHMRPQQVYCDLNSTAPKVKLAIDELLRSSNVGFVEGAILGAIGVTGARTHILLAGRQAQALSGTLNALGLNTSFYGDEIGKASTFKMLRSVFSKGVEAILIEFMLAAHKAGLERELWKDVTKLFAENTFEEVARNWVLTHATAHARRRDEMVQVAGVLKDLGLEPIMTAATTRLFERSGDVGLAKVFAAKPQAVEEVIRELLDRVSTPQVAS